MGTWALALTVAVTLLVRPSAQGCERNAPLAPADVERLVEAGVPDEILQAALAACGTTFIADDEAADRLRRAGASPTIVGMLAGSPAPAAGTRWTSPIDGTAMVWIPPGSFRMGSPATESGRIDDERAHDVRIGRGFWMDAGEVSNAAFRRFILANPSWRKDQIARGLHDGNYLQDWRGNDFPTGKGEVPVVWVSWHAALAYARWAGKRLPTEAEWEYAARSGTQSAYWWGDAFDEKRVARRDAPTAPAAAGSPWGLVGMLGGVWEWTSTVYAAYPYQAEDGREDPAPGSARVKRGGSSGSGARFLRAAQRSRELPELTSDVLGFRCVR
jgi:formylglycine-generating enzyme required for sulfatase activity